MAMAMALGMMWSTLSAPPWPHNQQMVDLARTLALALRNGRPCRPASLATRMAGLLRYDWLLYERIVAILSSTVQAPWLLRA